MRFFIFIISICIALISNVVKAQNTCSPSSIAGVTDDTGEICIEIISPIIDPSVGFIIGTTYTVDIRPDYSRSPDTDCIRGPGNCDCDAISWVTSPNVTIVPSDPICATTYDITISDGSTATVNLSSDPQPIPQDPSNTCYTQCTLYNNIEINAITAPPPYTGICTELCPGVGLKSSGFEGNESEWTYRVNSLSGVPYEPSLALAASPEHTIIDGANYEIFTYGGVDYSVPNSGIFDPFTNTNQKALALGHGDTRDLEGKNYYSATIEQTFFVGENYEPKLDIWYSWVAGLSPNGILKSEPIFSIKLYRFYEDRDINGRLVTVKEEIYSHIDTEKTYDHKEGNKIWRHWWDKKTIDLTPYKLERLHLEITSYDRTYQGTDYNSMAFVDISCSTCCTPSEVANNETQSLTINPIMTGIVNIIRPTQICEEPTDPTTPFNESNDREACNPTFFYQIIDSNGEPYVIEQQGREVTFRPTSIGQYQIRYKEDRTCCWSEFQIFSVTQIVASNTFSNDLKSAAISCIPSFEMDEVLAVNVASFGDRQLVNPKDIVTSNRKAIASEVAVTEPKNPYLTGERGIWRTEASYAYVTDREGYETETDMNAVKEGGTFDLNMFNWTTQGVVPKNWRRVNHVSRYDGYTHEIENRDILGRYSSALYGYNGQLATAVASNAAYYEIANEGFDAYQVTEDTPRQQLFDQSCMSHDGNPACIRPWIFSQITIRSGTFGGGTYNVEPFPILGYEVGKTYAFSIEGQCVNDSDINSTSYNDALDWLFSSGVLQRIAEDEKHIVFKILPRPSGANSFDISYNFQNSYLNACSNGGHSDIRCFYRNTSDPIQTETNFEINNLYKDGDKDRNVILQVLWAKGDKGVVEGYTPGEGATVTLDASVLAYTIGKQGAMDITPNLSVNTTDNTYSINEKVEIILTHRDATTSWFTLVAKNGYTLPEEWSEKDEQWYGSVRLARTLPRIGNTEENENTRNYEALTPVSHTGNQGLAPSEEVIIQEKLLLIPNKEYVFSAWVKLSSTENQPYTYKNGDLVGAQLSFYTNGSDANSPISFLNPDYNIDDDIVENDQEYINVIKIYPTGAIIEGWQRIEGTFTVPTGSMFTGVYLKGPENRIVYDDVRIYPANGMMKTYVYNPSNYLLQAVLDENNYATLYYYDEEQRLYLVQKETREGVQTIQETRSYIKPKEE